MVPLARLKAPQLSHNSRKCTLASLRHVPFPLAFIAFVPFIYVLLPMPRHRRQRPAWLPAWVPYKDGRYLGLARQTILAWSSTLLAMAFFLMTIAYATRTGRFPRPHFVHASQSSTILILRILSEAHGIFLAGSVYSTFEVMQWVLISRAEGLQLPQFLALQSSTGPLGLMAIALGKGLPPGDWPMRPRLMSLLRLIAQAVVPLTGVMVMSERTRFGVTFEDALISRRPSDYLSRVHATTRYHDAFCVWHGGFQRESRPANGSLARHSVQYGIRIVLDQPHACNRYHAGSREEKA